MGIEYKHVAKHQAPFRSSSEHLHPNHGHAEENMHPQGNKMVGGEVGVERPVEVKKSPVSTSSYLSSSSSTSSLSLTPLKSSTETQMSSEGDVDAILHEVWLSDAVQMAVKDTERITQRAKNNLEEYSSNKKPITRFLDQGGSFPVVLLTCNRPQLLDATLHSLLQVEGVSRDNLVVMQDGDLPEVGTVVSKYQLKVHRSTDEGAAPGSPALRGPKRRAPHMDGAARIAAHYKFSLSKAFRENPQAPAIIIVEDDLAFSPDFYQYFVANAPVLEQDRSLFLLSAWNDNGFKGHVKDPFALMRTEYFPGLGWLLPRALYEEELEAQWPQSHWDHWLRSFHVNKGREIVYPQVPRSFHNGIKGTFMDLSTHNRYFRDIDYNRKALSWPGSAGHITEAEAKGKVPGVMGDGYQGVATRGTSPILGVTRAVYDARIIGMLKKCEHLSAAPELFGRNASGVEDAGAAKKAQQGRLVCIWINVDPEPSGGSRQLFSDMAAYFNLWHEHRRAAHRGVHEFYFLSNYVVVLNLFNEGHKVQSFGKYKPAGVPVLEPKFFKTPHMLLLKRKAMYSNVRMTAVVAADIDMDCNHVCSHDEGDGVKKGCDDKLFDFLNVCGRMKDTFGCSKCVTSLGAEQPAFEVPQSPSALPGGLCLITQDASQSTCSAKHPKTKRLCPCVPLSSS